MMISLSKRPSSHLPCPSQKSETIAIQQQRDLRIGHHGQYSTQQQQVQIRQHPQGFHPAKLQGILSRQNPYQYSYSDNGL